MSYSACPLCSYVLLRLFLGLFALVRSVLMSCPVCSVCPYVCLSFVPPFFCSSVFFLYFLFRLSLCLMSVCSVLLRLFEG